MRVRPEKRVAALKSDPRNLIPSNGSDKLLIDAFEISGPCGRRVVDPKARVSRKVLAMCLGASGHVIDPKHGIVEITQIFKIKPEDKPEA